MKAQQEDSYCQSLINQIKESGEPVSLSTRKGVYVVVKDDVLYALVRENDDRGTKQDRMVIYVPDSMRTHICNLYHGELPMGHLDYKKTRQRISKLYFWPTVNKDIEFHVRSCLICQRRNQGELTRQGSIHP